MPSFKAYSCADCSFVAQSRRMLARHVTSIHATKVYRCVLCHFVSSYQANFYRHKNDVHGLQRSSCEYCGFHADSVKSLNTHKETHHMDVCEGVQVKHEEVPWFPSNFDVDNFGVDGKFDLQPLVFNSVSMQGTEIPINGEQVDDAIIKPVPRSFPDRDTATFDASGGNLLEYLGKQLMEENNLTLPVHRENMNIASDSMQPFKLRKLYRCADCSTETKNPREFLYHRRDAHNERITIHECPFCIYASKHIQKLRRHCNLMHSTLMKSAGVLLGNNMINNSETLKFSTPMMPLVPDVPIRPTCRPTVSINEDLPQCRDSDPVSSKSKRVVLMKAGSEQVYKCSNCHFQTRSNFLLKQHEKTSHLKKKFYRCLQCGYVANERGRYMKHLKYHSLPQKKCDYCDFKSAYKWNMERHRRSHYTGGDYKCEQCCFTAHSKQSLSIHLSNHHGENVEMFDTLSDGTAKDCISLSVPTEEVQPKQNVYTNPGNSHQNASLFKNSLPFNTGISQAQDSIASVDTEKQNIQRKKKLQCHYCEYKAAWPSELRRHELLHNKPKKHACPLCGICFDHLAYVLRHLRRMHQHDPRADVISEVIQVLEPKNKKKRKPKVDDTIKPSSVSRVVPSSVSRVVPSEVGASDKVNSPMCHICGYKTRWISELEKHMRVHTNEKPFACDYCEYSCKWKGDLSRHIQKHHGEETLPPNVFNSEETQVHPLKCMNLLIDKMPVAAKPATDSKLNIAGSFNMNKPAALSKPSIGKNGKPREQDGPLDLSVPKYNMCIKDSKCIPITKDSSRKLGTTLQADGPQKRLAPMKISFKPGKVPDEGEGMHQKCSVVPSFPDKQLKKRYKCTSCPFTAQTASRFHVHMVQHLNKRPFMCSECGYRSNWEWDITKHIKMKAFRDTGHDAAFVLLADESGRRNYEKYRKFLTEVAEDDYQDYSLEEPSSSGHTVSNSSNKEKQVSAVPNPVPPLEGTPESIVVTPDFSSFIDAFNPQPDQRLPNLFLNLDDQPDENSSDPMKLFKCKHCSYSHAEKKVVVSHLNVHAGIKPFLCRVCGLASNWRSTVMRHIKLRHGGNIKDLLELISYTQEGPDGRIISLQGVANRPDTMSEAALKVDEVFQCEFCPYNCERYYFMKSHMKQHRPREGAIFKCPHCPYYVKFRKTLAKHTRLHKEFGANKKPREASGISSSATDEGESAFAELPLDKPVESVSFPMADREPRKFGQSISHPAQKSPKRHCCDHCPYSTDNKTQFLYHKQFHRPNRNARFQCMYCTYWVTHQHLLYQHLRVHGHGMNDVIRPSKVAASTEMETLPERHSTFGPMKIAMAKPTGHKQMFKCRFCPMMNKRRANVRSHEKLHMQNSLSKFKCELCNYHCLNQGSLTNHMKIHQSENHSEQSGMQESNQAVDQLSASTLQLPPAEPPPQVTDIAQNLVPYVATPRRKVFSYFCMKCPALFKSHIDWRAHMAFHGALHPFPCSHCDYRARHKSHLNKHLQVHTPQYVAKRELHCPVRRDPEPPQPQIQQSQSEDPEEVESDVVDQMLLLEEAETKTYLETQSTVNHQQKLHECYKCPAKFFKSNTLAYHILLHGSKASLICPSCNYATNSSSNMSQHIKLHGKVISPVKHHSPRIFACSNCPAVFDKIGRFNKHTSLHGQNSRYTCDQCDYSVHFAANLFKHKKVHEPSYSSSRLMQSPVPVSTPVPTSADTTETIFQSTEDTVEVIRDLADQTPDNVPDHHDEKEKRFFHCNRCPYVHARKDAVQSHLKRHGSKDGMTCPYCDYTSLQASFLRDHMKLHLKPQQHAKVQAYIQYESLEVWSIDNGEKELIFKDNGVEAAAEDRFYPSSEHCDTIQKRTTILHDGPPTEGLQQCSVAVVEMQEEHVETAAFTESNLLANLLKNGKRRPDSMGEATQLPDDEVLSKRLLQSHLETVDNGDILEVRRICKTEILSGDNQEIPELATTEMSPRKEEDSTVVLPDRENSTRTSNDMGGQGNLETVVVEERPFAVTLEALEAVESLATSEDFNTQDGMSVAQDTASITDVTKIKLEKGSLPELSACMLTSPGIFSQSPTHYPASHVERWSVPLQNKSVPVSDHDSIPLWPFDPITKLNCITQCNIKPSGSILPLEVDGVPNSEKGTELGYVYCGKEFPYQGSSTTKSNTKNDENCLLSNSVTLDCVGGDCLPADAAVSHDSSFANGSDYQSDFVTLVEKQSPAYASVVSGTKAKDIGSRTDSETLQDKSSKDVVNQCMRTSQNGHSLDAVGSNTTSTLRYAGTFLDESTPKHQSNT